MPRVQGSPEVEPAPSRLSLLPFLHEEGPLGIRTLEKMRHVHLSTSPLENSPRSCSYWGGWERQGFGGDRQGPVWGSASKEAKEPPGRQPRVPAVGQGVREEERMLSLDSADGR